MTDEINFSSDEDELELTEQELADCAEIANLLALELFADGSNEMGDHLEVRRQGDLVRQWIFKSAQACIYNTFKELRMMGQAD